LKKHANENHVLIAKKFEKEVNSPMRGSAERQPTKKKGLLCLAMQYIIRLVSKIFFKKMIYNKNIFARPWSLDCEK
jgi:hypothetical protein